MKDDYPLVSADAEGVWCQYQPDPATKIGIRWSEIAAVTGYKLDCITEVDTIVTLDFDFGEYLELNSSFPGFEAVLSAIGSQLPLPTDWATRLDALSHDDPPLTIWRRLSAETVWTCPVSVDSLLLGFGSLSSGGLGGRAPQHQGPGRERVARLD